MSVYTCCQCGGTNLETLMAAWYKVNEEKFSDSEFHEAELYGYRYWCYDCQDHVDHFVVKEEKTDD